MCKLIGVQSQTEDKMMFDFGLLVVHIQGSRESRWATIDDIIDIFRPVSGGTENTLHSQSPECD